MGSRYIPNSQPNKAMADIMEKQKKRKQQRAKESLFDALEAIGKLFNSEALSGFSKAIGNAGVKPAFEGLTEIGAMLDKAKEN